MQPRSKNSFLPQSKSNIGAIGESIAASYLLRHHFKILARNFKARYGEIDIVARDGNTLVFVEVKTRTNTLYGSPETSVTRRKLLEVTKTGYVYTQLHPDAPKSLRVDVIGIMLNPSDHRLESLRYIKNVTGD